MVASAKTTGERAVVWTIDDGKRSGCDDTASVTAIGVDLTDDDVAGGIGDVDMS